MVPVPGLGCRARADGVPSRCGTVWGGTMVHEVLPWASPGHRYLPTELNVAVVKVLPWASPGHSYLPKDQLRGGEGPPVGQSGPCTAVLFRGAQGRKRADGI